MQNVYTVRQVNSYIKGMFTQDFMLNRIYVKGEVSNCKYHTSGHIYFSLKDESGTIACVLFAGSRSGLSFHMREGQNVIVLGGINVYERTGSYQLYARQIVLDGRGALYEKYEALKKELEEMGMFAPEYKRPIPRFARRVGIVTAPTGAAVRDIIHIARRRNPYVQLILYPALVQGEGAAQSIIEGIRMLERLSPDVIIIGRGGGSIEDLWAFNEEPVARAVFECGIPIISAVGHETDTVITDYVADLRAPTPSAAAELAVYEYDALAGELAEMRNRLRLAQKRNLEQYRQKAEQYGYRLAMQHPRQKLNQQIQYQEDLDNRLRQAMRQRLVAARQRLAIDIERMKGVSPLARLSRGYAYVEDEQGQSLRSVAQTGPGRTMSVYVADGMIQAEVLKVIQEEHNGGRESD